MCPHETGLCTFSAYVLCDCLVQAGANSLKSDDFWLAFSCAAGFLSLILVDICFIFLRYFF